MKRVQNWNLFIQQNIEITGTPFLSIAERYRQVIIVSDTLREKMQDNTRLQP